MKKKLQALASCVKMELNLVKMVSAQKQGQVVIG